MLVHLQNQVTKFSQLFAVDEKNRQLAAVCRAISYFLHRACPLPYASHNYSMKFSSSVLAASISFASSTVGRSLVGLQLWQRNRELGKYPPQPLYHSAKRYPVVS